MSYGDYVKENIFDKCGMTKTSSMAKDDMTYQPVGFEELAQYGFTDKDGYPAGPNNYRGDSGMHSCLTDMVKFDRALFAGEFLNEESMKTLLCLRVGYTVTTFVQTLAGTIQRHCHYISTNMHIQIQIWIRQLHAWTNTTAFHPPIYYSILHAIGHKL